MILTNKALIILFLYLFQSIKSIHQHKFIQQKQIKQNLVDFQDMQGRKIGKYHLIAVLGKGGYGTVYKALTDDEEAYALKYVEHTQQQIDFVIKEAKRYEDLNHPSIVKLHEYFHDSNSKSHLAIVLEYCGKKDLAQCIGDKDFLKSLTIEKCIQILIQITAGLVYLHEQKGIIHRDIKPDNILMTDDYLPKIGDLGNSKNTETSKRTTNNKGTFTYWAPELCAKMEGEKAYDFKIDVWALGIVTLELLLGRQSCTFVEPYSPAAMQDGFPPVSLLNEIQNTSLRKLVIQMLTKDPKHRLSSRQVFNLLHKINSEKDQKISNDLCTKINKYQKQIFFSQLSKNTQFPNLHTIVLEGEQITDTELEVLAENFKNFPNLHTINLYNNKITDAGLKALAENSENLPNLHTINLNFNKITGAGLKTLVEKFKNLPNLHTIDIGSNKIQDAGLKVLAENSKNLPNLHTIDLRFNYITDAGFKILADNFKNLLNLHTIIFYSNKITDAGLEALAENSKYLSKLHTIDFQCNYITDAGLKVLADNFKNLPNLHTIDLKLNKITDAGLKAVAENCKSLPNLNKINFGSNCITDAGLRALAENSKNLPKLHTIILQYNHITDAGLKALAENSNNFPKLHRVDLRHNRITERTKNKVQKKVKFGISAWPYNEDFKCEIA